MESAELKNQRLKEVFQTKIQEFRKVCYTLTGYQVDITTENQYRLTSMYAEQKADCLIFKVGRGAPRALPCPPPSASTPPAPPRGPRTPHHSVLWGLRNRGKVREGPSARPRVQLDGGGRDQ